MKLITSCRKSVCVRNTALYVWVVGIYLLCCSHVAAEQASPFWFRSTFGMSTMVSHDQLNRMGYDQYGIVGDAQIAYSILPWLDPYAGVVASAFVSTPQPTGGLLAPNAGVMLNLLQDDYRPYTHIDIGMGLTGSIVRPLLRLGLGVDIFLSKEFAFGPTLGYGQLFQSDAPNYSTDARFIWAGCALYYRYRTTDKPRAKKAPKLAKRKAPNPAPISPPVEPSPALLELIERTLPAGSNRVELLAPVLFAFDSDQLEPIGVAMLHEVAHLLQHRTDIELLQIQGYADSRGSTAYNRALSKKRADRVFAWLVDHGVAPDRLQVAGEGESLLVESGKNEKAHQQNRRVVFRVIRLREP